MSRPDLEAFFAFIHRRRAARAALARGEKPSTGCAVLDAYDLGYRVPLEPRSDQALKALHALGYRRPPYFDKFVYAYQTVDLIRATYNTRYAVDWSGRGLTHSEMSALLVSYRHYRELKAGVKTRWKLLPKKLKHPAKTMHVSETP
jgi:hypothetical protein